MLTFFVATYLTLQPAARGQGRRFCPRRRPLPRLLLQLLPPQRHLLKGRLRWRPLLWRPSPLQLITRARLKSPTQMSLAHTPTVPPEENRDRILSAAMARATVERQGADSSSPGDPLAPPATLPGNPAELEPRHDSPTAVSRLATQLPKLLEALQEGLESARECAVSAL